MLEGLKSEARKVGKGLALSALVSLAGCAREHETEPVSPLDAVVDGIRDKFTIPELLVDLRILLDTALAVACLDAVKRRRERSEAEKREDARHIQVSIHTIQSRGEQAGVLHIERLAARGIDEIFGNGPQAEAVSKAIRKKLHAKEKGIGDPLLELDPSLREAIQYRLMELCEGLFTTRVPAEAVIAHIKKGGQVTYTRYVLALTLERYPAQESNKVARLIGVSEDEMEPVKLAEVVCEPGKGYQHWRFRTHNFMVADWKKAPEDRKACFSIEIPVALT